MKICQGILTGKVEGSQNNFVENVAPKKRWLISSKVIHEHHYKTCLMFVAIFKHRRRHLIFTFQRNFRKRGALELSGNAIKIINDSLQLFKTSNLGKTTFQTKRFCKEVGRRQCSECSPNLSRERKKSYCTSNEKIYFQNWRKFSSDFVLIS